MSWQHKYAGKTEEATKRQLQNLVVGRVKRARRAEAKSPSLKDPAYKTDIIKFAEEQFYIPETRKPILRSFQRVTPSRRYYMIPSSFIQL